MSETNPPLGGNPIELQHPKWRYVLVILAAFMINFTACGILFGFGVYQEHYETMALQKGSPFTGASSAAIDLIGSLSVSLMTITAPFVMAWVRYFKPQTVIWAGGILFGVANVLTSFGEALWHFQLAQGLLLGIATGLSFVPSMTISPTWFDKQRGLAMGIISAGTGIGGLVWTPAISACVSSMGFRNTLRLTACLATTVICISGCALDWEPSVAEHLSAQNKSLSTGKALFKIPLPSWQTVKQRRFILQAASAVFQSAAYYTPVFLTVVYGKTLGFDEKSGANLTAVSNACNALGKIAVGFLSDRVGRLNSFFLTTLVTAIVSLGLWVPSTLVGNTNKSLARNLFISFAVLYGIFASAFVSLFPVALVELFGVKELPRLAGVMYMLQGLAALVGTPTAGALIQGPEALRDANSFTPTAVLVGALMATAAIAVAGVRLEATRVPAGGLWRWRWKL